MESPGIYPESPMEGDDVTYPCKGCGEILEEGKAFELAGNRWHIDCFRCNTCQTLLDSDANLLLLGDGSLICNNCTYSCSACGDKIEDLAILTGEQAFCANCFRCRNCKRKIENLRYARTSQGIFCMSCHESLMARRRKKSRAALAQQRAANNASSPMLLDKVLPSLPPNVASQTDASSGRDTPSSELQTDTPTESSPRPQRSNSHADSSKSLKRDRSPQPLENGHKENIPPASISPAHHPDLISLHVHDPSTRAARLSDTFHVPLVLDTGTTAEPFEMAGSHQMHSEAGKPERKQSKTKDSRPADWDYFTSTRYQPPSRHSSYDRHITPTSGLARDRDGLPGSSHEASPQRSYSETILSPVGELTDSQKAKPKAAQENGLTDPPGSKSTSPTTGPDEIRLQHATARPPSLNGKIQSTHGERFQLQEVPRGKKSGASFRSSQPESQSPVEGKTPPSGTPTSTGTKFPPRTTSDRKVSFSEAEMSPSRTRQPDHSSRTSSESRRQEEDLIDLSHSQSSLTFKPLESSVFSTNDAPRDVRSRKAVPKKAVPSQLVTKSSSSSTHAQDHTQSGSSGVTADESPGAPGTSTNGTRESSHSIDSLPGLGNEVGERTTRPPRRQASSNAAYDEAFTSPRAPPQPPLSHLHSLEQSSGASHLEAARNGDPQTSPGLPQYSNSGEFNLEEDMARILGGNDEGSNSLLRRVSNVVRHGRSVSDMEGRARMSAKWPRSPRTNGALTSPHARDIGSPTTTSPESREENAQLKHELRRSAQKIVELEARVTSSTDMTSLDTKLREKRSTVAFLDTQKELMVRELEILTEHVAETKRSQEPFNIDVLKTKVVREFASSLEKLKSTYGPEVEDLIQTKNQLIEETTNLARLRDQAIQETETLNLKNAQLADLNNELTQQIQERYRAHRAGGFLEGSRPAMKGLGIHGPPGRDRSESYPDGREPRPGQISAPPTLNGSTTTTLVEQPEGEASGVMTASHVVNMRKGQAKKFNWKKGSQSVAKGVSKGFKGAFSSNTQNQYQHQISNPSQSQRECYPPEGTPYGMVPLMETPVSTPQRPTAEPPRHGFFGQKLGKGAATKTQSSNSLAQAAAELPSVLFGSDLTERADYERRAIPSIVTRCIEEVELRGMDLEGIYRKTGGNGQVKLVRDGFEKSDDHDISDPELDITAVTSVLKQYLRKLPNPLVTHEAYDTILEANTCDDEGERAQAFRVAIQQFPTKHRDCLEFVIFHLARVAERDKENLMTPRNLAVVFAPTIMRDERIDREITDMRAKNAAIQFLIENNKVIFGND